MLCFPGRLESFRWRGQWPRDRWRAPRSALGEEIDLTVPEFTQGTLVGRESELVTLVRGLQSARAGRGGLYVVSGGRGIGKSRLVEELACKASAGGFKVVRAHFMPGSRQCAGWVWREIIRECVNEASAETEVSGSEAPCGKAASLMRVLSARDRFSSYANVGRTAPAYGRGEGFYLAESIARLVRNASREHPLLLSLDGLQDADEFSLRVLHHLNRSLQGMRIVVVAALRGRGPGARRALEGAIGQAQHIELAPLRQSATADLLARILGGTPDERTLRDVYEATGGNPLFITEIADSLIREETGVCVPRSLRITAAIRDAVVAQFEALDETARRLLDVASVIGHEFDPALVCAALGLGVDEAAPILAQLERAGVIGQDRGTGRYRFAAGLIRQALYEDCPGPTKVAFHRNVAQALEALGPRETHAAEIAWHFFASADQSRAGKLIDYAEMAARQAAARGDFAEAGRLYSMAADALRLREAKDSSRLCDLLFRLGEVRTRAGDYSAAHEALRDAAEIAERMDDHRRLAQITVQLPGPCWPPPGVGNSFAVLLGERALCLMKEEGDPELRAAVTARLAVEMSYLPGERKRSAQLAAQAFELAESVSSPTLLLRMRHFRDALLRCPDLIEERLSNATEMIRLARENGAYGSLYLGIMTRIVSLIELGEMSRADAEADLMRHAAAMSHEPQYEGAAITYRAARAVMEGRFSDGERLFAQCRGVAARHGAAALEDLCWPAMVMPLAEQKRSGELEGLVAAASQSRPNASAYRAMLSWAAVELGKVHQARFHLERMAIDNFAVLRNRGAGLACAAALAEVAIALDDKPRAAALYEILLPYAHRVAILGPAAILGAAARFLGKLAASLSRVDDALRHLEDAISLNRSIGARPWVALSAYDLATALARNGRPDDRDRVLQLLSDAHEEAANLGMARLVKRVEVLRESFADNAKQPLAAREDDGTGLRSIENSPPHFSVPNKLADVVTFPAERNDLKPEGRPGRSGPASDAAASIIFRRDGEYWTLGYQARVIRLRHCKGLTIILHLMRNPGRLFHVVELSTIAQKSVVAPGPSTNEGGFPSDIGPALDARAKESYKKRIRELREELEEAQRFNDAGRTARIEEEIGFISREFARGLGLNGRDRRVGSYSERARARITVSIKSALAKISEHHEALGCYLSRAVKTGTYCSYISDGANSLHTSDGHFPLAETRVYE